MPRRSRGRRSPPGMFLRRSGAECFPVAATGDEETFQICATGKHSPTHSDGGTFLTTSQTGKHPLCGRRGNISGDLFATYRNVPPSCWRKHKMFPRRHQQGGICSPVGRAAEMLPRRGGASGRGSDGGTLPEKVPYCGRDDETFSGMFPRRACQSDGGTFQRFLTGKHSRLFSRRSDGETSQAQV